MNRHLLALLGLLAVAAGPASAIPQLHLNNQVNALLKSVADALESDGAMKGKTVSFGTFGSKRRPDSRYGSELRHLFEQGFDAREKPRDGAPLKDRVVADGALVVAVNYDLADSEKDTFEDGGKVLVLRITVEVLEGEKNLLTKNAEVNVTEDIAVTFGLTLAPPPPGGEKGQQARNDAARKAAEHAKGKRPADITPTFQVKDGTKVGVPGCDLFFVEVLVKDTPDGPAKAAKPKANAKGDASVDVRPEQFYELVVHNFDEYACVAKITIDGQDAANRFNADKQKYSGLLVTPEAKSGLLKGWLHTTERREKEKDNVFAFAVKEYYPGAKDAKVPSPGEVGVISVQFALAWKEGTPQPTPKGRDTGRVTEKGPPLPQDFKVEKYQHAAFNETITIRYDNK